MQFNVFKCLLYYVADDVYNYRGRIICNVKPNDYREHCQIVLQL